VSCVAGDEVDVAAPADADAESDVCREVRRASKAGENWSEEFDD